MGQIRFGENIEFSSRVGEYGAVIQSGVCPYCKETNGDATKMCYKSMGPGRFCDRPKGHDGPCVCCMAMFQEHIIGGFWHGKGIGHIKEYYFFDKKLSVAGIGKKGV